MLQPLRQLKDKHKGEDVYLLASGASLDYYPRDFFRERLSVGVNKVAQHFSSTYTVMHHHENIPELIGLDTTLAVSRFMRCISAEGTMHIDLLRQGSRTHYQYESLEQGFTHIDYSAYELDNHLITGGSSMVSALHFCHYIGAGTIFVCGMDGRAVNGKMNFEGYHTQKEMQEAQVGHVDRTKAMLLQVCHFLKGKGASILGVNPFIDLNLRVDLFEAR
ncbi:MAG: hypothetical protein H6558_21810 [Lewinellaceae bacterium]|nr:hypothetical protein [Lewinellaceae bacterium]